jgi:hypothetical protein
MALGGLRGGNHLLVGGVLVADADVVEDALLKQEYILEYEADLFTSDIRFSCRVHQHRRSGCFPPPHRKSADEMCDGAFAASEGPTIAVI